MAEARDDVDRDRGRGEEGAGERREGNGPSAAHALYYKVICAESSREHRPDEKAGRLRPCAGSDRMLPSTFYELMVCGRHTRS